MCRSIAKIVPCCFFLLLLVTSSAFAQNHQDYKILSVRTPDGIQISAQEWGNPNGPEIVLIHGYMQSHLAWSKQVRSALAKEYRIITYDVRGHGGSDKILEKYLYDHGSGPHQGERYADELAAVMAAADLKKPVLVGWSYGSGIICDYIRKYGTEKAAGINFVGSSLVARDHREWLGPTYALIREIISEDLERNIRGMRKFVRGCFAKQPTQEEFETILSYNAMVPVKVRLWLGYRPNYEDILTAARIPILFTHGTEDQVIKADMARYLVTKVPNARLSLYEGIGHSPFWEDSLRFNAELSSFVKKSTTAVSQ